jgi:hypothetical protein
VTGSSFFSASWIIRSWSFTDIALGLPLDPMKSPTPSVSLIVNQTFSGCAFLVQLQLDEHVAGVELAVALLADALLVGADALGRDEDPADVGLEALDLDLPI